MSETKQTRCPFCNSVFNITDAQLSARGGHVRCGACLQVFRADQNLVSGTAPTPAAKPATPSPSTDEKPIAPPIVARTQSAPPLAESSAPKKKKKLDDESWAFNLLGEEAGEVAPPEAPAAAPQPAPPPQPAPYAAPARGKKPLFDDELSDMLHEAWQEKPRDAAELTGIGEVDKLKESADESWAQALLSEIAEEEKKEQQKNYSMEIKRKESDSTRKASPASAAPAAAVKAPAAEAPKAVPVPAPAPAGAASTADDDLLNFLNSNSAPTMTAGSASLPVEVRDHRTFSINWGYYLVWSFLSALALATLVAQYVYFNFTQLAVKPDTRPQIVALCDVIKCTVPEPPDINLINVRKVVVRHHPDVKGALKADAVLYNKASFTQPLPLLKLALLNRKGEPIAERIFRPKEYLQGDAASLRRIPPDTPIYISLDLANPGFEPSGYRMEPLFP